MRPNLPYKILPLLLFSLLWNLKSIAQDSPGPIQTDRPGLGESSQIVPLKCINIEIGGNLEFDSEPTAKSYNMSWNNSTLRLGLFQNFELRIAGNLEQSIQRVGGITTKTKIGVTPWSLGFKARVSEQNKWIPRTALLGNISIPFPSASFLKTSHIAPSILAPMEWDLSNRWLLTVNTGIFWNGEDAAPDYFSSLGFDCSVLDNLIVFVEGYMNWDGRQDFQPALNGGVVWQVMPNLQFDLSAGLGLKQEMADGFVNGGVSFRLPR
jgi:hypothetical protein